MFRLGSDSARKDFGVPVSLMYGILQRPLLELGIEGTVFAPEERSVPRVSGVNLPGFILGGFSFVIYGPLTGLVVGVK